MTTVFAGVVITMCAIAAGSAAAVPGRLSGGNGLQPEWNYQWSLWPLVAGLAVAGVVLSARPRWSRPAAVVAAVLAGQVAGHGIVAVRDWFNTAGASGGMRQNELALVVGFAAVVAVCATVAGCAGVAVVWREPARGWGSLRPRKPGYALAGLAVAAGLPVVLAAGFQTAAVTVLGQFALTFSLPWGAGLAAAGWLGPRGRRAALGAVGVSVLVVVAAFGAEVAFFFARR